MAQKTNDLIVDNFQRGIAQSPHLGFAHMRNVDIRSVPGVAKINYKTTKKSSTTVTGQILWKVQNPKVATDFYAIDDGTVVYKSTDYGETWTTVAGNTTGDANVGLTIWKDYLFAFRAAAVDVYGPLSSSPSWSNSWKSYGGSPYKPAIAGQDDILYFGNGRYVGSVSETAGQTFAPGNSATYTYNDKALTLPAEYKVKCFAELGKFLMAGTFRGNVFNQQKVADIFPWDRSSTSYNLPLRLSEFGVNQLLTINNVVVIQAGTKGRYYYTNGTSTQPLVDIGKALQYSTSSGFNCEAFPGAIMNHQGRVFVGISTLTTGVTGLAPMGVWSFKPDPADPQLVFENQISTGTVSGSTATRITSLISVDEDQYLIGWGDNGAAFGIDKVVTTDRYTSYSAYVDSGLYQVGTSIHKRTFSEIEPILDRPLATGQGVKLYYRLNLSDAFTLLATFDFATHTGVKSFQFHAPIDAEHLQIRAELTTGSSSTTTPHLKAVILR